MRTNECARAHTLAASCKARAPALDMRELLQATCWAAAGDLCHSAPAFCISARTVFVATGRYHHGSRDEALRRCGLAHAYCGAGLTQLPRPTILTPADAYNITHASVTLQSDRAALSQAHPASGFEPHNMQHVPGGLGVAIAVAAGLSNRRSCP
jgi:hypothetical protein